MSRILVVYATTHGQTAKIAAAVARTLRTQGAIVDLHDASAGPHPEPYDGIIVAASVHTGKYQRAVVRWAQSHRAVLSSKTTAFLSVCLAVLQPEPEVRQKLAEILDRFTAAAAWQPTMVKHVAGALPYTKYNWLTRFVMKRIVKRAGGNTDTTRDFEYTDWADLTVFATQFGQLVDRAHTRSVAVAEPEFAGTSAR